MDQLEASKEPSKNALKKAAKQAQMAADKTAKAAKQAAIPVQTKVSKSGAGDELIGITASKETDFPAWYQEVVQKGEMVEYYNEISGFFILMPTAMYIWKIIHSMSIFYLVYRSANSTILRFHSYYQLQGIHPVLRCLQYNMK